LLFHDLRHTRNTFAAQTYLSTKDLTARTDQGISRAALIYQHAYRQVDQTIVDKLSTLIDGDDWHGARSRSFPGQVPAMEAGDGSNSRLELGNLPTVQGDVRRPADGLGRGVPQVTAIDPSLQHVDSTTVVILTARHSIQFTLLAFHVRSILETICKSVGVRLPRFESLMRHTAKRPLSGTDKCVVAVGRRVRCSQMLLLR
jgi:hypothetical protein